MSQPISYNTGAVADFASDTGDRAGNLGQIHEDAEHKTNALLDFFTGQGADGFFTAQQTMLDGLRGLIETIGAHASTTSHVLEGAIATDQAIANIFPG